MSRERVVAHTHMTLHGGVVLHRARDLVVRSVAQS